ncbi:uncharacterized protein JCM10292_005567 [Rhodotorula paludigena]|uniref:uncharacterized protein n=1 Tax=Rhodotorula paludigena TaxID=86838 RepID=UPI0031733385
MAEFQAQLEFPLLKLVSNARSTYGLRHQDFARYKSHCVAKVHHLRKAAGLSQTQGKSRKYQGKPVQADQVTSDRHLQIVLFDAERCWAQSQLLKSTLDDPAAPPSTKHHFAKRLSKASSHAAALVALSQDPALSSRLSASHTAQIQAYALVQSGALAFERGKHADGLRALSCAYAVLEHLAGTAASATDEALANEVMDEVEPMLRFCAYRLGKDTSAGVGAIARDVAASELGAVVPAWSDLAARLDAEGRAGKKESVEIRWRGEVVPVRNAELVGPAIKVQEALASLRADEAQSLKKKGGEGAQGKKKAEDAPKKEVLGARRMGSYDKALLVLSDAEAVAHQLVEDDQIALAKGNTARFEATSRPLSLFHSYIQYHLLSVRTKRDLHLIASSLSKLASREHKLRATEAAYVSQTQSRDPAVLEGKLRRLRAKAYPGIVKVYDTVLLSLEAMRDLEAVEQDDELATRIEARIALVRAHRCKFLSRAYALASSFPSSLSLLSRAKLYVREARQVAQTLAEAFAPSASDEHDDGEEDLVDPVLPLEEHTFAALEAELDADEKQVGDAWFDTTGGEPAASSSVDVGALSLDEPEQGQEEKKKERKVPFYDVAYNYVAAFDLDAIAARAGLASSDSANAVAAATAAAGAAGEAMQQDDEAEEEEEKEEPQPAKRGWGFGLFGRR